MSSAEALERLTSLVPGATAGAGSLNPQNLQKLAPSSSATPHMLQYEGLNPSRPVEPTGTSQSSVTQTVPLPRPEAGYFPSTQEVEGEAAYETRGRWERTSSPS